MQIGSATGLRRLAQALQAGKGDYDDLVAGGEMGVEAHGCLRPPEPLFLDTVVSTSTLYSSFVWRSQLGVVGLESVGVTADSNSPFAIRLLLQLMSAVNTHALP